MRKWILVFFILCLVPGITGCSGTQEIDFKSYFAAGREYDLALNLNEVESEAHLIFEENQSIRLTLSGNPLLQGLEILLSEEGNRFSYLGLQLSMEERLPAAESVRRCFNFLAAQSYVPKKTETLDGVECYRFSFQDAEMQIDFWVKKETAAPLKIQAQIGENSLQLKFRSEG